MNHSKNLALLLLLLYTICYFPQLLTAASLSSISGDADKPPSEHLHQTVSLPGPVSENVSSTVEDAKVEVKPPAAQESCELASNKCHEHDDVMNVTACLFPAPGDGPMGLLVLNDGNGTLKFNVTIPPSKPNSDAIEIPAHKGRKINLSSSVSNAASVVLKADSWTCTIQLGVPVPLASQSYSYAAAVYVTPVNRAYLLFVTVLLIGLIWACYKLRKTRQHSDGIPYQELEMGQKQSTSSINVETAVGWDQGWDDDWDEEKAVRSPGENHIGNRRANGESNGWDDDWKD